MIIEEYFENILNILKKIKTTQYEKITLASKVVADVIEKNGIIYIFGCGHSHLIALDCFYRAGGLANVSAMLDTDLMLHNGAAKSSVMEKISGISESIFERYCLTDKDMLFVISTSGKNAVPIEMAEVAVKRGIRTVGVLSSEYFENRTESRMLHNVCELFIDNCVPHGDAVLSLNKANVKIGSVSTAASSFIMQTILANGAQIALDNGVNVPIYMSGNVHGGSKYNKEIVKQYIHRIKHL